MSEATATMPRRPKVRTYSYTFELLAPRNIAAELIGSFSDWKPVPMEKGDDGRFRVSVDLADGTYGYKFKVRSKSWFYEEDQWVDVIDPYATEIDAEGQHGIMHVRAGRRHVDDYEWQHDDVALPPNEALVIYELHVGDFTGGEADPFQRGKFSDLAERLDYLQSLGVNAIEMMPIKDNPFSYSWGYSPRNFCAPDTSYGSSVDLKKFVDACHGRGMRVFIDGVYNHAETSMPLTQIDHDYWFHHEPKDKDFSWGPEFNYMQHDADLDLWPARKFITDTIDFWVREYHLDGIRYDACRQIGNFDAMRLFSETARAAASPRPFYNVAEYIPQDPAVTNLEGPMDGAWHDNFFHAMYDLMCRDQFDAERLKSVIDGRREGFGASVNMVNYCSNHDHDHVLAALGDNGIFDDDAFIRHQLGAVICFTAVGIPLLWMGEEFGEYHAKTEEECKIDWKLLEVERNAGLLERYRRLIHLRTSSPALHGSDLDFFYEHIESQVLAWLRWSGDAGVISLVNCSGHEQVAKIENWPPGRWHSLLQELPELEGPVCEIPLHPYESRVYVRV